MHSIDTLLLPPTPTTAEWINSQTTNAEKPRSLALGLLNIQSENKAVSKSRSIKGTIYKGEYSQPRVHVLAHMKIKDCIIRTSPGVHKTWSSKFESSEEWSPLESMYQGVLATVLTPFQQQHAAVQQIVWACFQSLILTFNFFITLVSFILRNSRANHIYNFIYQHTEVLTCNCRKQTICIVDKDYTLHNNLYMRISTKTRKCGHSGPWFQWSSCRYYCLVRWYRSIRVECFNPSPDFSFSKKNITNLTKTPFQDILGPFRFMICPSLLRNWNGLVHSYTSAICWL